MQKKFRKQLQTIIISNKSFNKRELMQNVLQCRSIHASMKYRFLKTLIFKLQEKS